MDGALLQLFENGIRRKERERMALNLFVFAAFVIGLGGVLGMLAG